MSLHQLCVHNVIDSSGRCHAIFIYFQLYFIHSLAFHNTAPVNSILSHFGHFQCKEEDEKKCLYVWRFFFCYSEKFELHTRWIREIVILCLKQFIRLFFCPKKQTHTQQNAWYFSDLYEIIYYILCNSGKTISKDDILQSSFFALLLFFFSFLVVVIIFICIRLCAMCQLCVLAKLCVWKILWKMRTIWWSVQYVYLRGRENEIVQ